MVKDKEDFWLKMDIKDLSEAGAFIPKEIWDSYILKEDNTKIKIKPKDFTKK